MLSFFKRLFGAKDEPKVIIREIGSDLPEKDYSQDIGPAKPFIHDETQVSPKDSKPSNNNRQKLDKHKSKPKIEHAHKLQAKKPEPQQPKIDKAKLHAEWNPESFTVQEQDGKLRFHDLNLSSELMHAIFDAGFEYCTPIQAEILPKAFEGKDVIGKAQTGTGKTAAFLISIIKNFQDSGYKQTKNATPGALILAPTRELALQIVKDADILTKYIDLSVMAVFGGMDYNKQLTRLQNECTDIVVATPGRLLDFKRRKDIDLSQVKTLVIDEADRMLDMGFIPDIKTIINSIPQNRHTMLFSATFNDDVLGLASRWSKNEYFVEIEPEQITGESIEQAAYMVSADDKYSLLYNMLITEEVEKSIIFCNRRDEAKRLHGKLLGNEVKCAILSGDMTQQKRIKTLEDFTSGKVKVLVATDVAARGLHVNDVSHVFNYTLPEDPEVYVHRIGRTGRAGAKGKSAILACEETSYNLPAIEEYIGTKINFVHPEQELLVPAPAPKFKPPKKPRTQRQPQKSGSRPPRKHHKPRRRQED